MRLGWRQGILYITIVGMESAWLYALLSLIDNRTATSLDLPWVIICLLFAFIINKIWSGRRIYLYPANGFAWAVVTLVLLKTQLLGGMRWFEPAWLRQSGPASLLIFSSLALWALGWRLARSKATFPTSIVEFQFGLTMLLLIFMVSSLTSQIAGLVPIALVFFFFALAGMALARNLDGEGWLAGANRGFWSGFLIAGIGLVLVLGIFIGTLVTHNFLELVLAPVKWTVGMIWKAIIFLISLLPQPAPGPLPPNTPVPDSASMEAEQMKKIISIPEWLKTWLNRGYVLIFVGLILGTLWRLSSQVLGWLRHRLATTVGAEVETMPGAFRQDLVRLLKNIWQSLLRLKSRIWRKREIEASLEASTVRQVYLQFLRWATKNGFPRDPSQTPTEYQHHLERLLPQVQPELSFITEEYVRARYSPWLPDNDEVDRLKETWRRLRQIGLKVVSNKPGQEVALNG